MSEDRVFGRRAAPFLGHTIVSNPTVRLTDLRARRFSIIDDYTREIEADIRESSQRHAQSICGMAYMSPVCIDNYWVEPENQDGRGKCMFCDKILKSIYKDMIYFVCEDCDRKNGEKNGS